MTAEEGGGDFLIAILETYKQALTGHADRLHPLLPSLPGNQPAGPSVV